jgi:hypothetical protein
MNRNPAKYGVSVVYLTAVALAMVFALPAAAQDFGGIEEAERAFRGPSYSPYANRNFPNQVLWGDTHLHTALSFDAGAFGNRLLPADAYRFAKGEELTSTTGVDVKLSRPLDWLVVADHSDNMGLFTRLFEGHPDILGDPEGRRIYDMIQAGGQTAVQASVELIDAFSRGVKVSDALAVEPGTPAFRSTWEHIVKAAEDANDPGRFTAFIGYEWTSLVDGDNLHRVVIFRDDADKALETVPYTTEPPIGSRDPRDLWKWMTNYEATTGGDLLALAHNGNMSNGIMFPVDKQYTGAAIDREYVTERATWEPLYEVTQIKGDGEAHPFLSPNDEFADYETWAKGNLNLSRPKENSMLEFEYARSALKNGLLLERKLGVNPYKFGMVGSTDSHTSLATAEEDNFLGKHAGAEPAKDRAEHVMAKFGDAEYIGWEMVASGYAAVWATENTREAIFEATERKEVYATTGPRMLVRFFGGWDFRPADAATRSPGFVGYRKGVPMGGDLAKAPAGKAPTFLVAALKDSIGGNLDRIQIVKGWLDKSGKTEERVYDVAVSDGRKINADGRCTTPVGNTVDVAKATWTNTIGDSELITVWRDPNFDPNVRSFYYARVIEIPTPRWTAYDATYFGVQLGSEVPMTTQERAYTSPIWYTP